MLAQVEAEVAVKKGEIDELRDRLQTERQAAKVAGDRTEPKFASIFIILNIKIFKFHSIFP